MSRGHSLLLSSQERWHSSSYSKYARLSAIDYLTGQVLIDRCVQNIESFVDYKLFQETWKAARTELWKYIDDCTILVGHGLQHDFHALGIHHSLVVDSQILVQEAIGLGVNRWLAPRHLCTQLLDEPYPKHAKKGVKPLMFASVVGKIAMWFVSHKEELMTWAGQKRLELQEEGHVDDGEMHPDSEVRGDEDDEGYDYTYDEMEIDDVRFIKQNSLFDRWFRGFGGYQSQLRVFGRPNDIGMA